MQTRVRYARILACVVLLLTPLLVAVVPGVSGYGKLHGTIQLTSANGTETSSTLSIMTVTTTTVTELRTTTTTKPTTSIISATVKVTESSWIMPAFVDDVVIPMDLIRAVVLGLVILTFMLTGSALVLRSRSSKALEEVGQLQSQLTGLSPERGSSASSALKLLLELGILEPKEYMEKKMIAERLERKMSAKQLLDEGLISKDQYDALARREESQNRN